MVKWLNKDSCEPNLMYWEDERFASLPLQFIKYGRIEREIHNIPECVQPLVEQMYNIIPKIPGFKYYLDYKVRDLEPLQYGCPIPGWHLDVVRNPNHNTRPDVHMIFTTECGTELLMNHIPLSKSCVDWKECLDLPRGEDEIIQLEPNKVHFYNRYQFHRGPIVERAMRRLMIRITGTEVI